MTVNNTSKATLQTTNQVGLSGQAIPAHLQATAQKATDSYDSIVRDRKARFGDNFADETEFLGRVLAISSSSSTTQKTVDAYDALVEARTQKTGGHVDESEFLEAVLALSQKEANMHQAQQKILAAKQEQDGAAKKTAAREMHQEFEQLKKNHSDAAFRQSPEFKQLAKSHDEVMQMAFAPIIPDWIVTKCTEKLSAIMPLLQTFAKECKTLAEFVGAKQQEDQINASIQAVKTDLLQDLRREGIALTAFDFQAAVDEPGLKTKVNTALTTELEKVTAPFRKAQEAKTKEQLAFIQHGFREQDMGGGGDCLFRAMAGGLGQDPNLTHEALRKQLVEQMRANSDRYKKLIEDRIKTEDPRVQQQIGNTPGKTTFERYLGWISQPGNWGGTPEIQAMSDLLQRPILVVQKIDHRGTVTEGLNTVYPETYQEMTPLAILNSGVMMSETQGTGVHFVSLLPTR